MKLFLFKTKQDPEIHPTDHAALDNRLILIEKTKKIQESMAERVDFETLTLAFKGLQEINFDKITDPAELKDASELVLGIQFSIMYQCELDYEKDHKNFDKLVLAFQVLQMIGDVDAIQDDDLWKAGKGYRGWIDARLSELKKTGALEAHMKEMPESLKIAITKFLEEKPTQKSKL